MATLETATVKFLVLLCLISSTAVSVALVIGNAKAISSSGSLYRFSVNHRASVQIIVQVLSHLLGSSLILVVTSLINFGTRLFLSHNAVSIHRLRWWNQLCNRRIVLDLPWKMAITLFLFYGMPCFNLGETGKP